MSRPPVLPLPDSQARRIIAAVDRLTTHAPAGQSSRPFLVGFIASVYEITGQVYGHGTYRRMLKLYAPQYRPSTPTIEAAIADFRATMPVGQADSGSGPRTLGKMRHQPIQRQVPAPQPESESLELARLQQLEIERLNAGLATLRGELASAQEAKDQLLARAISAESRASVLDTTLAELRDKVTELLNVVERTQAQADASHRHALMQVEQVRRETREARDETERAMRQLAAREAELRNERTMTSALRQQVNDLRARLGVQQ